MRNYTEHELDLIKDSINDKDLQDIIDEYALQRKANSFIMDWVQENEPEDFRDITPDEYMDKYDKRIYPAIKQKLVEHIMSELLFEK